PPGERVIGVRRRPPPLRFTSGQDDSLLRQLHFHTLPLSLSDSSGPQGRRRLAVPVVDWRTGRRRGDAGRRVGRLVRNRTSAPAVEADGAPGGDTCLASGPDVRIEPHCNVAGARAVIGTTSCARLQGPTWWGRSRLSMSGVIGGPVVATVATRLLIVAGGLVSSVLTARWLSPSGRGEYFLIVTLAQTLAQFGNFGLQSSNTYFVARDRSLRGPLLANSIWIAVGVGGVGSLIVILALEMMGAASGGGRLWFAALLAPATLFFMFGTNLLVGLKRIGTYNKFQLGSNYGVLLCLVVAAALGAGPRGFVAASTLGWTAVSVALLVALRRGSSASLGFNRPVFREGFRYSLNAYIVTLCGFLVLRSNVFIVSALRGPEQVGYYSIASQIADIMGILPQSMALVLFPTLITTEEGRLRTTLRHMMIVGMLLAAGCGIVGILAEP